VETKVLIFSLITGYLLGSISFTRVLAKILGIGNEIEKTEMDIRGTDEKFSLHSISATSMAVRKGPLFGITVSILDMLKAYFPVAYFLNEYPNEYYYLIVSMACILGHNFPVFYKFKGGRGMSPLLGSLFVFDWRSTVVMTFGGMILGLLILRDMFFAFTSGPILLIPYFWITRQSLIFIIYSLIINAIFWIAVLPEIRTYLSLRKRGILQEAKRLERAEPSKGGTLGRLARIFRIKDKDDSNSK
jgi:glycerol-3-phosphate acyltransferase PlsY